VTFGLIAAERMKKRKGRSRQFHAPARPTKVVGVDWAAEINDAVGPFQELLPLAAIKSIGSQEG
jgi:hypothetical protein